MLASVRWPFSLCAGAVLFSGCNTAEMVALEPRGRNVEIVEGQPNGCNPIREVIASSEGETLEEALQGARNDLRNRTAARGGNYASLQTYHSTRGDWGIKVVMSGTALRCD
jgi:Domain of unknown function (DUF4156)